MVVFKICSRHGYSIGVYVVVAFKICTESAIDMNGDANRLLSLDLLDMRNSNSETFLIKHHKINKSHFFVIHINAFTAAAHIQTHSSIL